MKTTVANLLTKMKLRYDYNITDTDLDSLLVGCINDSLKLIYQWLFDAGKFLDISSSTSFKTTKDQAYIDLQTARIVGDKTTFTGIALDTIIATVDGTASASIDVSGDASIADVLAAINTAVVAGSPASEDDDGYLVLTSLTTGATSAVVIANGATGVAMSKLFSVAAERTNSALTDMDSIVRLTERTNDRPIQLIPYYDFIAMFPDPTSNKSATPDYAAIWNNRLYLGPTPSASTLLVYIEYMAIPVDVTSLSTLPYLTKYDPLILAQSRVEYLQFKDETNTGAITIAQGVADRLKHDLITAASRDLGVNNQTASRRSGEFFGPRIPTDPGTIDAFA